MRLSIDTTYWRNCGSKTVAWQQRIILASLVHIDMYSSIIITLKKERTRDKETNAPLRNLYQLDS